MWMVILAILGYIVIVIVSILLIVLFFAPVNIWAYGVTAKKPKHKKWGGWLCILQLILIIGFLLYAEIVSFQRTRVWGDTMWIVNREPVP